MDVGEGLTWNAVHSVEEEDLVDVDVAEAGPLFHEESNLEGTVGFERGSAVGVCVVEVVGGVPAGALLQDLGTAGMGVDVACCESVRGSSSWK